MLRWRCPWAVSWVWAWHGDEKRVGSWRLKSYLDRILSKRRRKLKETDTLGLATSGRDRWVRGRGSRLRWGPVSERGHAHQEGEAGVKRQWETVHRSQTGRESIGSVNTLRATWAWDANMEIRGAAGNLCRTPSLRCIQPRLEEGLGGRDQCHSLLLLLLSHFSCVRLCVTP